ncbi:MAG: type II secretion system protein [Eubacteriaceae bacterium]|nr:type II secretion system protein [Eubacteriaceae bacterium]
MIKYALKNKSMGFSLIEVITSLAVISLVFIMLLSGLFFANTANKKAHSNQKIYRDERYLNLYIQKQVLESEKIIFNAETGIVYLRDLETPDLYYNYYTNSNGLVYRIKVKKATLMDIGGGKSQFADSIQDFSLSLTPDNAVVLRYTLSYAGETIQRETIIQQGKTVEER